MRVLVAPDKLKGSLTAKAAAEAMARGVERAGGSVIGVLPLADGGEGSLEALLAAWGGELRSARVKGALGHEVVARLGLLEGGRTALVESAEAIGLARLSAHRDVLSASSYGVGQLIRAALDAGVERVLIALGGSATNDGGAGALQALGLELVGAPCPVTARDLDRVTRLERGSVDPRLAKVEVVALCDVSSPLTGPTGASLLFAAQKGASADEARALDRALARLAELAGFAADTPGAGAAGGLGFGLAAFAGARLAPGADFVLDAVELERRLRDAELVLTAEGCLDAQTLQGKLVCRLGERCQRAGVPVIAFAGRVAVEAALLAEHGLIAAFPLADGPMTEAESVARAGELLAGAVERVLALSARLRRTEHA
ncbi:MAG: glycerate kinase [Polyangiaceae bacterium]|nr:glycerate kinase [Polyangiaceae bacterium]MCL4751986.1 glycerate kinase [Myxococcales bacterium]